MRSLSIGNNQASSREVMGYDSKTMVIGASVSSHNSPKDSEHVALWEDLARRVAGIVQEEKYAEIGAWCA